ncbi:MAG: tetratricopeptide repeat protein [bacterium]|nr:tetratricopeptide repeat protein [bacterium]
MPLRALLACAFLVQLALAPALAQERAQNDDGLERFRTYLKRSPYHERVLDNLVDAAVARGMLDELVEEYRGAVRSPSADAADRVVLVRLLAKLDEVDEARALLEDLPVPATDGERTSRHLLGAELARADGDTDAVLASLTLAADATEATGDSDALRRILRSIAETHHGRGEPDGAHTAFVHLAEAFPDDFANRRDVADLMVESGLGERAIAQYDAALALARGDGRRTAETLVAKGRLLESIQSGREALAAYEEARALTLRGGWLRTDLEARVLDLHASGGTLPELIAARRAAMTAAPTDIAMREDLARALVRAGAAAEALDVLTQATADFPLDTGLSRALRVAARAAGRPGAALSELQRLAGAAPGDVDIAFELASALLADGKLEAAQQRFERVLAGRRDASLMRRVANAWARHEHPERAVAAHTRAIEAAPRVARGHLELARFHFERGERAAAVEVLKRAEEPLAGNLDGLQDLAELYRKLDERAAAARLYAHTLELVPDTPKVLSRLAELEVTLGEREAARAHLRRLIEVAEAGTLRTEAVGRLVALAESEGEREEWVRAERETLERDPEQRAAYLLLAGLLVERPRSTESDGASQVFEDYLARWPDDIEARRQLAQRLVLLGRTRRALKHYNLLLEKEPQLRASFLIAKAGIYTTQGHERRAIASLTAARRDAARSLELLRRISRAYASLDRKDLAIEALEQALRVAPDDGRSAYELAELHMDRRARSGEALEASVRDRAIAALLITYRTGERKMRKRAASDLRRLYAEGDQLAAVVADLGQRVRDNPYDTQSPPLLVDLLMLDGDYVRAHEVLERELGRRPDDTRLISQRAAVFARGGRYDEALADVRRLVEQGESIDAEVLGLLPAFIKAKRVADLLELGARIEDPLPLSRGLLRAGFYREAIAYLRSWADGSGLDNDSVVELLAAHHRYMDDPEFAIEVLEARERLAGPSFETTRQLGALYHEHGDREKVLACGRRLIALEVTEPELEHFFESVGMRGELTRLRAERVVGAGLSFQEIDTTLEGFLHQRFDAPGALEMIASLRKRLEDEGAVPAGFEPAAWSAYLHSFELALYRRNARLVAPRLDALGALRDSDAGDDALAAWDWSLLMRLSLMPGAGGDRSMWRKARREERVDPRIVEPGLARFPCDPMVLTAAALVLDALDRRPRAAELYTRLAEALATPAGRHVEAWTGRDDRRQRERVLAASTIQAERGDPEHHARVLRLTFPASPVSTPRPRAVLTPSELQRKLAVCLARTGATERARDLVRDSAPLAQDDLYSWFEVAEAYLACGFRDEAHAVLGRLWGLRAELREDPRLRTVRPIWEDTFQRRFGYLCGTSVVTLWWGLS